MSEPHDNSGAVFVNDRKERDNHPDRKGSARIDGVDYWVSGWLKRDRSGNPFLSLAFSRKEDRGAKPAQMASKPDSGFGDMSDDIPF